ncbi:UDP-N-acetylmuramate dehydrogenase [Paenibacillus oenotherae]|uniref:UDP-N-acetylenolpyruvoylglucosamine reductase n=1 Tax=Paenibacillus oenotherae TaxID=1435645 RepID=A0ABS7DB47_9BACL|nr:UDP-N-acetylmuramate dehydrogenase [Paenibacillus oenotherae]MBW7476727.1 UDP-N-acetylmuramate dehydrogenase [Paenibacillus oenotherae]
MFQDINCTVKENFPLKGITTMGVGGNASYYVVPNRLEDVPEIKRRCDEAGIPLLVVGKGSNLIVSDEGYRGVVLHVGNGLKRLELREEGLYGEAGVPLPLIALTMAKQGIEGFEFMAGIPGSVGGAVVMNAGCLGRETSTVLRSVTCLTDTGEMIVKHKDELELSFRSSFFLGRNDIILSALFDVQYSDNPEGVREKTREAADIRKGKFPINVATAGSTFKSPPEGPHPGKLIQEVGLKGHRIGGAQISEVHGNWIINTDNATCEDVKRLIDLMQETVARKLSVLMEPEVLFV